MNKKGFAISVVLYTMVLLVIGIFYLLLGIVRHRYTVGNDLKEQVIDSIRPGCPRSDELRDIIECSEFLSDIEDGAKIFVDNDIKTNYVWYSGKLWRIVCINSDGTIKLVTQGNVTTIAWNPSNTNTDYRTSQVRRWLNNEFLPTLVNADDLLVDSTWDYTTYASSTTTKADSPNIITNEKVGLLTIYEYYRTVSDTSFLNNYYDWWTMSSKNTNTLFWYIGSSGAQGYTTSTTSFGIRPSVNLKADIRITGGDGTKSNPYIIEGDKVSGATSDLLSTRISGEYIDFNNTLYRIVEIKEVNGAKLTKVTMADYSKNKNTLTTSLAFGASTSQRIFSPTYGIGLYLEEWYKADETSSTYGDIYIEDNYKSMIATPEDDGVVWYTGPSTGNKYDYTLSKSTNEIKTVIGLGYYGEMFSSQFGDGGDISTTTWLMTICSNTGAWEISEYGSASMAGYRATWGVRPSMYLKSNVKITSGNGMPHNPYEITM